MSSEASDSASIYDLLAWFEVNKKRLLTGAVVVGVLAFVISLVVYLNKQKEIAANDALLRLTPATPSGNVPSADYLKIAAEFPSTHAGARASLEAATALYAEQKYDAALQQFNKFQSTHASSPLMPQAALGVAACLEALDKIEDAIKAYQTVASLYPKESVAAQAKLSLGRLCEDKKQSDQALKYYDEILAQPSRSIWYGEASDRRQELLQQFPNLAPKPVSTQPASISGSASNASLPSILGNTAKTNPPTAPATTPSASPAPTNASWPATTPVERVAPQTTAPSTNK